MTASPDPTHDNEALEAFARGDWSKAAGLTETDVLALSRVGASALLAGRTSLATTVFAGLAALEPDAAAHHLHHAAALRAGGDVPGALAALARALAAHNLDDGTAVHALLLQAELLAATDRAAARVALAHAQERARSPAGKNAWEQR